MTKLRQAGDYHMPIVDRGGRPGTVLRIILLALVLVAAAAAFVFFKESARKRDGARHSRRARHGRHLLPGLLGDRLHRSHAAVATRRTRPRFSRQPSGRHADHRRKGRIIYANAAYGELTGARKPTEIQTLETLLSRNREATEAIYRLTNGLHEGKAGHEEFRLLRALGPSVARTVPVRTGTASRPGR